MKTLYLDINTWDLTVDSDGNIAVAGEPYSFAQDAASAIQTYLGEVYFDTSIGIPYQNAILGHGIPLELYRSQCIRAALTVPGVVSAQVFFTEVKHRVLTGQVQVTDNNGNITIASISAAPAQNNLFTLNDSLLDGPSILDY